MYNVANKRTLLGVAMAMLLFSCGGKDTDTERAEAIVNQADSAITAGDYDLAVTLLDTLKSRYPREIKVQRGAMNLRPRAIEGQTIRQIEITDSMLAASSHRRDSMMNHFSFVNNPELVEGYYVIKEYANSSLFNRTGVEARITPEGEFYIISSLNAKPVKHTSLSLKNQAGEVSTATVDYDGDRNYRSGGTEMITFVGAECDTLGQFLTDNRGAATTLIFNGAKSYSTPLSKLDRKSIEQTYEMANVLTENRKLNLKRDFLDRQLQVARDQIARTTQEPAADDKD